MRSSILSGVRAGSLVLLLALALPARCDVAVASEFFHEGMGHYFVTAFAGEGAALDARPSWARTATQYRVHDAPGPGLVPVCRFFSASFAPLSSHFYTADTAECEIVKRNPSWTYEGIAFFVQPAAADGACAAGWGPIYRLYNDGRTGAPNHRYTPWSAERADFVARGWIAEGAGPLGVAFCVPYTPDVDRRLRTFANSGWQFVYRRENTTVTWGVVLGEPRATGVGEVPEDVPLLGRDSEFVRWDPFLGRMVAFLRAFEGPVRFVFEYDGGDVVAGCAYEPSDRDSHAEPSAADAGARFRPCQPFTGSRF